MRKNTPTKTTPSLASKNSNSGNNVNLPKEIKDKNLSIVINSINESKESGNLQPRGGEPIISTILLENSGCILPPSTVCTSSISFGSTNINLDIDPKTPNGIQTYNPFTVLSNLESDAKSTNISDINTKDAALKIICEKMVTEEN